MSVSPVNRLHFWQKPPEESIFPQPQLGKSFCPPGCTKAFSQLSNLQSHSRCHQSDKPYKCNSCYKCFTDEPALLEHIPKHRDSKHVKTHICAYCGKSYTQVYSEKAFEVQLMRYQSHCRRLTWRSTCRSTRTGWTREPPSTLGLAILCLASLTPTGQVLTIADHLSNRIEILTGSPRQDGPPGRHVRLPPPTPCRPPPRRA